MTDLEAIKDLYYRYKGPRIRIFNPFLSFCEFKIIFPGKKKSKATKLLEKAYIFYAKEFYLAIREDQPMATSFEILLKNNKKLRENCLNQMNRIRQRFWYWEEVTIKRK